MNRIVLAVCILGLAVQYGNAQTMNAMFDQLMANPLLLSAMSQSGAGAGGAGGAGGGMDPMMQMMMMNQLGGGGGMNFANMNPMQMMMMQNMFSGGNQAGAQVQPVNANRQGANVNAIRNSIQQAMASVAKQPKNQGQKSALPAALNPSLPPKKMLEFMKSGVGVNSKIAKMICQKQTCPFPLPCDNPVITYKPETFFVCPNCPQCPNQAMAGALSSLNIKAASAARTSTRSATRSAVSG